MSTQENIIIKGAKVHNLKNISISIPKEKFTVISGVSGSGKSSLAFNTLYAEGQRRYIESLSSYARQFLGKIQKPDVDEIRGICPAIAIEQKTISKNPRSTVGTSTEIYDYLKLIFARIGTTYSPISGHKVKRHQISDVCDFITQQDEGRKVLILAQFNKVTNGSSLISILHQQGFSRVQIDGETFKIRQLIDHNTIVDEDKVLVIVDRIVVNNEEKSRIADSVQTAFYEGNGECVIDIDGEHHHFSNKFELDGITFEKPSVHLFSFNNPFGACPKCEGYGSILGIDEDKVIKNEDLSVYSGAVSCWSGQKLGKWKDRFILRAVKFDFPIHRPYNQLSNNEKNILWNGKDKCKGIMQFFNMLEADKYKIQNRVLIARYRGKTKCDTCFGSRLRQDALYVQIAHKNIAQICAMSIQDSLAFFNTIKLSKAKHKIAERLIIEIKNRLHYLNEVGLGYLNLNRKSTTLSGGESQRINLVTSIGSALVGAMYILDEPSIGLHSKDTKQLIKVLKELCNIGNTVIVVEHDEEIMEQADQIIDLGPEAGTQGGEIVFQGLLKDIYTEQRSLTMQYLSNTLNIDIPNSRYNWKESIKIKGIKQHNLNNVNVVFPLGCLALVTGVSGSGKTTLIKEVLKPALANYLGFYEKSADNFKEIIVNNQALKGLEFIDQNPIGKSSRSNPATYIKAYDEIRSLFAKQPLAVSRNYSSGFFSFNITGGRCDHCNGEGEITVEMQFMADVHLQCEHCKGKRFQEEILEIQFADKNIAEILELSVDAAIDFFNTNNQKNIAKKLFPLQEVGLGYVCLGQSSNTLSGGEAQRIKLASFLGKGVTQNKTLFIFDEPTTGLHFHDINKLLKSFYSLIEKGHSIICIEHNLDVIKCADWVIDLGPEGGNKGGEIVFSGTPEAMIKCKKSETGKYLKKKL